MDIQQAKEFGAMQEDIKNVKNDVSEIKKDLKDFILSAETKYASKWAERVWIFVCSAIGVGDSLVLIGKQMVSLTTLKVNSKNGLRLNASPTMFKT